MINLIILFLIAIGIQILFFIPAFLFKTDKLTDFSYGITFIVLSFTSFFMGEQKQGQLILLLFILIWAIRLVSYLFIRIRKIKKDQRFDQIRGNFLKFLKFWIGQGFTVWVILIPSLFYFNLFDAKQNIWWLIGGIIFISGFLIESIADYQKYKFINNPKNKDKWISSGLWYYSRHPNYFGEILIWTGIYIFTLGSLSLIKSLIGLISPLFITIILLFVTGVPILEKKSDQKWGDNKDYLNYKKRTNKIIINPFKKN